MTLQEAGIVATIAVGGITLIVAFARLGLSQFERRINERFRQLSVDIGAESKQMQDLKTRVDALAHSLANEYVRREDWIRFSNVIDAKLDRLSERIAELGFRRQP
jgi:hypothetical protein